MKKIIFTAILAVSVSLSVSSQTVNLSNSRAVRNFETNFINAENVQWVSRDNFTKALFTLDGRNVEAFYNPAGDFIATTNHIDMQDLPLFVKKTLEKKYSDYEVYEAFELIADNDSTFFISAGNEIDKIVLKVENGAISVYSRASKNDHLSLQ